MEVTKFPTLIYLKENYEFTRFHIELDIPILQKYLQDLPHDQIQENSEGNIYEYLEKKKSGGLQLKRYSLNLLNFVTNSPKTGSLLLVINLLAFYALFRFSGLISKLIIPKN